MRFPSQKNDNIPDNLIDTYYLGEVSCQNIKKQTQHFPELRVNYCVCFVSVKRNGA